MADAVVKARLLRQGNSLCLRISEHDAMRLGLREGTEVNVRIDSEPGPIDLSVLPTIRGKGTEGRDHDTMLGEARTGKSRE